MIRVAIVEDDAEVQGVLQEYVRRYTRQYGTEFEVTVFADGVDILEDYRAVYDIIFLDVEMKHLDGMTTAERIRQMDADVILIFITVSYTHLDVYKRQSQCSAEPPRTLLQDELSFGRCNHCLLYTSRCV